MSPPSDYADFEELRDERHERKFFLRDFLRDKKRELKEEAVKEEEVDDAYSALLDAEKESKKTPIGPLRGQFYLYCSDHLELCYKEDFRMKYLEFYTPRNSAGAVGVEDGAGLGLAC